MQRSEMEPGRLYAYDPGTGMPVVPVVAMDTRSWEDARGCALGTDAMEDVRAANGGYTLGLARAGLWRPRAGSAWETAVGALVAWIPGTPGVPHAGARDAARRLAELDLPVLGQPSAEDVSRRLAAWHQHLGEGPREGMDLAVVLPQRVLMAWADWVERETARVRRRAQMEKSRLSASEALAERAGTLASTLADWGLKAAVQAAPGSDPLDGRDCDLVATLDAETLVGYLGDVHNKVVALETKIRELRSELVRMAAGRRVPDGPSDAGDVTLGDGVSAGQD